MQQTLTEMIRSTDNIVFFGGAGVSTESGLPDFRSDNGRFRAIQRFGYAPEELLSYSFFLKKPEVFYSYYRLTMLDMSVQPNRAHVALAKLEEAKKLKAVITQNIDGLHQKVGSKNVLELHGSIYRNFCMQCGLAHGIRAILTKVEVPRCGCGGLIKPDVVLYGEELNQLTVDASSEHITNADMLIVGGTSLSVYPAAGLIDNYRGKKLVLINKSTTPFDAKANLIINDSIGKVLFESTQEVL